MFAGDLREGAGDSLVVRVSNTGLSWVYEPFQVRVSRCGVDSSGCQPISQIDPGGPLAPGGVEDIAVPWGRFGEMVFRVEVDTDNRIAEQDEEDNRAFQRVRLVPQQKIAVFPNPFRPGRNRYLSFSGLPLRSRVQIATLQGEAFWSASEDHQGSLTREIRWHGGNQAGLVVSSGIYAYTITAEDGRVLGRDRIAVMRE